MDDNHVAIAIKVPVDVYKDLRSVQAILSFEYQESWELAEAITALLVIAIRDFKAARGVYIYDHK